jgi:hypothetical protein
VLSKAGNDDCGKRESQYDAVKSIKSPMPELGLSINTGSLTLLFTAALNTVLERHSVINGTGWPTDSNLQSESTIRSKYLFLIVDSVDSQILCLLTPVCGFTLYILL